MADKKYKWAHPAEWLQERIQEAATKVDIEMLASFARSLAGALDSDELQDLFQEEMDQDGYFDEIAEEA